MTAPLQMFGLQEAEEVGCFGLADGFARHLYSREILHASQCTKDDGPFCCPECFSDAVVRKCHEKKDHFAHKARLSPVIGVGDKELHDHCRDEIAVRLQEHFPGGNWAKERTIPENRRKGVPELRPDVSGRINGCPVAIEVQASALTIPKIVQRARDYTKTGIALLWVVPLREPLGELPFRPRLYERYLHGIYYGRTYYWWAGLGLILKAVHYGKEYRHVEYREWYEDGEHMQGGDYDAEYKTIKRPVYGADINIAVDFEKHFRGEFVPENEKKTIPACLVWRDRLDAWWGVR